MAGYSAVTPFGVLFYDNVCSVEATLTTNEINYFCERQRRSTSMVAEMCQYSMSRICV